MVTRASGGYVNLLQSASSRHLHCKPTAADTPVLRARLPKTANAVTQYFMAFLLRGRPLPWFQTLPDVICSRSSAKPLAADHRFKIRGVRLHEDAPEGAVAEQITFRIRNGLNLKIAPVIWPGQLRHHVRYGYLGREQLPIKRCPFRMKRPGAHSQLADLCAPSLAEEANSRLGNLTPGDGE
jgi:hypothetical protein